MNLDTSLSPMFPEYDMDGIMMPSMSSPPLDTIHLVNPSLEPERQEHFYYPMVHLDQRRFRLEQEIMPLEKWARGSFSTSSSSFMDTQRTYASCHYPSSPGFEKDDSSPAFGSYYLGQNDYPSPVSHGVDSLSGIEVRSPSPGYVRSAYPVEVEDIRAGFPRWGGGIGADYISVVPQELHKEITPVLQNVSHTFPCVSIGHTQDKVPTSYVLNDDVDADGESDEMCDGQEDLNSDPIIPAASKRMSINTKKRTQDGGSSRKGAAAASTTTTSTPLPKSSIHKRRAASSKYSQSSATKNRTQATKETVKPSSTPSSAAHDREKIYSCSFKKYGCESKFKTKNEWKRHFATQHLKLEYYRCDLNGCYKSPKGTNDFNRKDLFTQHIRRMHSPFTGQQKNPPTIEEKKAFDKSLEELARRCRHELRTPPPKTSCATCNTIFRDWSSRMEHMSHHYEHDSQFEEARDPDLEEWACEQKILDMDSSSNELVLAHLAQERRKTQNH